MRKAGKVGRESGGSILGHRGNCFPDYGGPYPELLSSSAFEEWGQKGLKKWPPTSHEILLRSTKGYG